MMDVVPSSQYTKLLPEFGHQGNQRGINGMGMHESAKNIGAGSKTSTINGIVVENSQFFDINDDDINESDYEGEEN